MNKIANAIGATVVAFLDFAVTCILATLTYCICMIMSFIYVAVVVIILGNY